MVVLCRLGESILFSLDSNEIMYSAKSVSIIDKKGGSYTNSQSMANENDAMQTTNNANQILLQCPFLLKRELTRYQLTSAMADDGTDSMIA